MGDAAEAIFDGLLCEQCGVLIDGDAPGYPRLCKTCEREEQRVIEQERKGRRGNE